MPLKVLILDEHAPQYVKQLAQQFPSVVFHAARVPEEARDFVTGAEVIIAVAHKLPHEMIDAARSLKWVQALSTGTDALIGALPSHILLTSTRGVHGPQMSETWGTAPESITLA